MKAERAEQGECDCCGYETELKGYSVQPHTLSGRDLDDPYHFCHICAATFLAECIIYPRLYGDNHHLWASIGWIANHLLAAIKDER